MPDLLVPRHIGFIVDGNRRWAKSHGIPVYEGHLAGYNALKEVMTATFDAGVEYASAYIFSTENWKRSKDEVGKLMGLVLRLLTSDLPMFRERNIRLLIIGSRDDLDEKLVKAIDNAEQETANNTGGTMGICFNYGGQLEIVDSIKKIIDSGVSSNQVTIDLVGQNIYYPEVPPVDLIVRTSGEQRISNFMLWRAAYAEMLFLEKMWPDMTNEDISYIIKEYNERSRRFGG